MAQGTTRERVEIALEWIILRYILRPFYYANIA